MDAWVEELNKKLQCQLFLVRLGLFFFQFIVGKMLENEDVLKIKCLLFTPG